MAFKIRVNGVDRTAEVDGDTPLLWVLRDVFGMTGTKFGCGVALCSACTVHLDGTPTRSCITTSIVSAARQSPRSKLLGTPRPVERFKRGVARSRSCPVRLFASRARLCPHPHCWRTIRIRQIPISTMQCPATSAGAVTYLRIREAIKRAAQSMILDHVIGRAAGPGLSQRQFLQVGAAMDGGLLLRLSLPLPNGEAEAAHGDGFAPNAFIRIDRDGQIVLTMPHVDMSQGTYTSIPMLLDEELEVDLNQVRLEHAPPHEKLYGNPLLGGVQATGNSNAVRASWQPLRQAGAIARAMLVSAAAKRWNVDHASCHAQSGEVFHASTGRRAKYGDLAADAARMPVPESVVRFASAGSSARSIAALSSTPTPFARRSRARSSSGSRRTDQLKSA